MTVDRPVVLVVGAASRDVTADDPRGWRLGGAVSYVSLALARLGLTVWTLAGVDAAAAAAGELDLLRRAGAIVTPVLLDAGPVFENVESPAGRRQRCLSVAGPIELTDVPRAWVSSFDALVLGPIAAELDDSWAALAADGLDTGSGDGPMLAVGWQGLLRTLRAGADVARIPPAPSAMLQRADLVVASRDDFAPGTQADDLMPLVGPAATLVITDAEAGGEILRRDASAGGAPVVAQVRYPAIPPDAVVDPTGAGDVFLAGMLAAMLVPALAPGTDGPMRLAAAAASLTIERPGLGGVPELAAVRVRMDRAPSLASRRPSAASSRGSGRPSQA